MHERRGDSVMTREILNLPQLRTRVLESIATECIIEDSARWEKLYQIRPVIKSLKRTLGSCFGRPRHSSAAVVCGIRAARALLRLVLACNWRHISSISV